MNYKELIKNLNKNLKIEDALLNKIERVKNEAKNKKLYIQILLPKEEHVTILDNGKVITKKYIPLDHDEGEYIYNSLIHILEYKLKNVKNNIVILKEELCELNKNNNKTTTL